MQPGATARRFLSPVCRAPYRSARCRHRSVSLIFTAFPIAKLVASPVTGVLASQYGRQRVLLVGVGLVSASTLCIGLAPDVAGPGEVRHCLSLTFHCLFTAFS